MFSRVLLTLFVLALPLAGNAEMLSVTGIVEPLHDAFLSASVAGRISETFYEEGDAVGEDDVILYLDKRLEELEVERRRLIWESKAELNAAAERVATLEIALDATRSLFKTTQSVSREELAMKELEYKIAVAESDRFASAEERERIEYEMALEQLSKRRVAAPFDGVLTDLFLDIGEDCEPRQPLARLVDARECTFVCNVEAATARGIEVDQPLRLELPGGESSVTLTGLVSFVSPIVDPASGLQKIKILFQNPDGRVSPGVSGTVFIPDGKD